jgi:hypothetical protein
MQSAKDSDLDRVGAVLSMRVADVADLIRLSTSITDFSVDELIRLANELPKYGHELVGSRSLIRTGARRPNR